MRRDLQASFIFIMISIISIVLFSSGSAAQTCSSLGFNIGDFKAVEICGVCYECGVSDFVCPEVYEGFGYQKCHVADIDCTNRNLPDPWGNRTVPGCPYCNQGWDSDIDDPFVDPHIPYGIYNISCLGGDCAPDYGPDDLICGNDTNEFPLEELDSEGDAWWVDNLAGNDVLPPFLEDVYGTMPAMTENVIDNTPSRSCCAAATDCVDDGICYISVNISCQDVINNTPYLGCNNNEAGEPIDIHGDMEVCNSSTWHDPDESADFCALAYTDMRPTVWYSAPSPWGVDDYDGDLTNGFCAGDDNSENLVRETDSPLNDGLDSASLCTLQSSCVDDSICYNSTNETAGVLAGAAIAQFHHDLGEDATGDWEICNSTDSNPALGRNDWHDPDEQHPVSPLLLDGPYCNTPYTINALTGLSMNGSCNGSSCWGYEGEDAVFGGFDIGAGNRQLGCCGDDLGEYYIVNNMTGYSSCCMAEDRCVYSAAGLCGGCDKVLGRVFVEDHNNPGTYINASDYGTGNDVLVIVYNRSNLQNFSYTKDNNVNGTHMYELTAPADPGFILTIEYRASRHYPVIRNLNINPGVNIMPDVYLDLVKECQEDCSMNDLRCHAGCDGIAGCDFNESIIATSGANIGKNVKEICDGSAVGWEKVLNDSYVFYCCDEDPISLVPQPLVPQPEADIENLKTFEHTVTFKGKKLKMYVTVWEKED